MIRYTSSKQMRLPGFETPFEIHLDPTNRWMKLAQVIPWDDLVYAYCQQMSMEHGAPAKSPRLMIGAMIIKHKQKFSDEETVRQIEENPYLQCFCGFEGWISGQPFAPSLFVEIRKRMGAGMFERFEESLQAELQRQEAAKQEYAGVTADRMNDQEGREEGNVKTDKEGSMHLVEETSDQAPLPVEKHSEEQEAAAPSEPRPQGKLIVDATACEQAIRYPTDLGLLNEAREISEKLIDRLFPMSGVQKKPRTYRQKARKAYLAVAKKRKPRYNVLRRAIKQQLQYLWRNLGHLDTLLDCFAPNLPCAVSAYGATPLNGAPRIHPLSHRHFRQLWVIRMVYDQQREMYDQRSNRCDDRIVSISQPHVRPIVRGKAGKSVEFGAKISVSLDGAGLARVDHLRWDAFNENGDLTDQIEAFRRRTGHYPAVVIADAIYGTRENRKYCKDRGIRYAGKPLGRPHKSTNENHKAILVEKRQRQQDHRDRIPIEGKFGQGKNGYGLNRIHAKRADTSESWIRAIFFVMNLMVVFRFFFALILASLRPLAARFTRSGRRHFAFLPLTGIHHPHLERCAFSGIQTF